MGTQQGCGFARGQWNVLAFAEWRGWYHSDSHSMGKDTPHGNSWPYSPEGQ